MIRRIAAAVLTLSLAAVLLVGVWPQLFGLQRVPVVAHIVALRGLAACAAAAAILLLVVIALLNQRFQRLGASLGVLLLAFILINSAVLSTRGFGDTDEAQGPSDLTVVAWNTLGPATHPDQVAKLAVEEEADIVVLPETIAANAIDVAVAMRAAGQPMWVHTLSYDEISPARSTSLLTSVDLGEYDYDSLAETTAVLPTVVATPRDGDGPTIVAVHAVAPIPGQFENWPNDLRLLASFCKGENIIMAGDFNATIDHMAGLGSEPGRALGDCADAAMLTKNAAMGTWPTALPALLGTPIDHVLTTDDWIPASMRVVESLDDDGSDHRPIVVQLKRTT